MSDKPTTQTDKAQNGEPAEQLKLLHEWINDSGFSVRTNGTRETVKQDSQEQNFYNRKPNGFWPSDSKECVRCHPEEKMPALNYRFYLSAVEPVDANSFAKFRNETRAEAEASYRSLNIFEKACKSLSQLPNEILLQFNEGSTLVRTDFLKLSDAVPTANLSDELKKFLASTRQAELIGDKLQVELTEPVCFDIELEHPLLTKLDSITLGQEDKRISFEASFEQEGHLSLKNMRGFDLNLASGKRLKIHQLSLDITHAKPLLITKFDNPKNAPKLMRDIWPKSVSLPIPVNSLFKSMHTDNENVKDIANFILMVKKAIEHRELPQERALLDSTSRDNIELLMKNLSSLSKKGDQIEIRFKGQLPKQILGSAEIDLNSTLAFSLSETSYGTYLSSIDGVQWKVPTPNVLVSQLGDNLNGNLTKLSLERSELPNCYKLSAGTNKIVDTIKVSLNDQFKPLIDSTGHYLVSAIVHNPLKPSATLDIELQFDKFGNPSNKTSDLLNLFSRATWQASDFSIEGAKMTGGSTLSGLASKALRLIGQ